MFHNWASTDGETVKIDADTQLGEVRCYQCGTVAPEWQSGAPYYVSVSHGALPIVCDGPTDRFAHHFTATGGEDDPIRCEWCGLRLCGCTAPDTVNWSCPGQER